MNEFLIQLQAILDRETSKGNINKSIERIQNQINKLKIQAEIDPKSIQSIKKQIEQITNHPITLTNINIDQSQMDKTGRDIGRGIADSVQREFNNSKINTDKLNADIKTLKNNLNNFASNNAGFDTFKTEINGVEVSLDSLIGKLSSVNNVTDLSTLRSQANALKTSFTEMAQANKIQMQLDTGGYESKIESLISRTMQWTDGNGNAKISTDALKQSLDKLAAASEAYANNKTEETQRRLIEADKELDKQVKTVTNSVRKMNAEFAKDSAISSLHNKIQAFYDNNSAAHGRWGAQLKQMLAETASGAELTTQRVHEIEQSFNGVAAAARQAGKVGKSWFQSLKESTKVFAAWTSPAAIIMKSVSEVKKAVSEMKELDNTLTEISKTSGMAGEELKELGMSAYDSASKYGRTASDYLTGVQEMARSGFYGNKGTAMAEQSLLAQAAGDMSADVANQYVLATNAAYKFNGEAEKLNAVLDGQNMVCNRNSVALADMAAGMSKAGTVASSYNVSVEDLTAMIGTMEAVTKSGGEEVGNSLKSILINLQNVTSSKITGTLSKANASMTEFVNGTEKLRNPIKILRDLAETFNKLDEDDPLRAEILTNVGGKYQASKLAALLQNVEMMDKMLVDYSEGSGSAMAESEKSANNLTGTLNKLSNSWTELVNTFADTDGLKGAVNVLNNVLQSVTGIVDKLKMSGTIGLGAGLFAGIKNIGIFKPVQSIDNNGVENTRVITSLQARRIAQEELNASMARQAAQLEADTAALQAYEAECAKGAVSTERFASIMNGASAEAQAYAVQTKGATGSAQAFTAGQQQVQAGLKATASASKAASIATKAFSTALNMIVFAAIAKGIQMIVSAVDNWIHRVEKANEAMSEAYSAYETSKSELESINSELKEQENRLDELSAKDKLTYAEKGELENLKEITEELRIQADIKERELAREQKESANEAVDAYNTQFGKSDITDGKIKERLNNAKAIGYNAVASGDDDISGKVAELLYFQDMLAETKRQLKDTNGMSDSEVGFLLDDQQRCIDQIEMLKGDLGETISILEEQRESMEAQYQVALQKQENGEILSSSNNDVIETYEKIEDNIRTIYSYMDSNAWNKMQIDSVFDSDGIEKTKEELVEMAKAGALNENTIQSYEKLNTALTSSRMVLEDGQTAARALCDEMYALAEAEKEVAEKSGDVETPKITTISGILEKFGQTEAIDEYKDRVSSLQSYLEKLEDGNFSPIDSEALAKEFNIVGDTAEECIDKINAKIQSEKNNIIAIIDDIIAKGLADGSIGDAELERLRSYRDILADIADVNLDNQLSFKTGNALADVQSLSQGLDQLDKIYADILDKKDFDFSSILNNDGFKEQFGAYTDEYENFINTVSKSPDDINACQDAFNKLTAAYIKGAGVLSEVTEATKQQTVNMLKQMGVANAAEIVEQALIENEKMLEAQKYATSQGCKDLEKATYEEINALIAEGETTEEVIKYLAKLAIEKWELNEKKLDTQADCDNLLKLAGYAGATAGQIRELKNAMADLSTFDFTNPKGSMMQIAFNKSFSAIADKLPESFKETKLFQTFAENSGLNAEKSIKETMEEIRKNLDTQLGISEFKVNYTGGTTTKDTLEKLAKEKEKEEKKNEETAEQFDWMDIKLNNLIDTASKLKDKISDLLSFGSKKKQTQKAIEATTKALEAEYKAMKKYAEVAKTLSADAAKETTETVTESISGAVSDAVSNMTSSVASDVVAEAMKYVGVLDYVWGGESLTKGADCSGFVQQVYRKLGMEIPRNTTGQYGDTNSISVSKADLQPGDLVFFQGSLGSPGNPRHVGIYAGNGQFIDSPTTGKKVQITSLSRRSDYVGAKRYAGASSAPVNSSVSYDTPSTTTKTYTKVVPGVDAKTLAHYQKLVREGSFDVETITNEKLKNAIKSYQEWYEKMKSCRDKIEELNNTLRELYQTMAEIPIEKRDKNVDTLDTRLDIINSKRDNINAVIVDPKKYASTKKTLKTSKTSVKKGLKGLRTKAQIKSAGLTKNDIKSIQDQMKKGQTIPAKILDKITDGAFYEQCKQYNDAVYEHSQYAKSIRTAGDSIKKFNTVSDQIFDAEKSKTKQYKTAYNTTSKSYAKSLDNVKSKGAQTKKAFGSKKFGLTSADINRINSCIKSGKQIPTDLMVQLQSQSIFDSCVEYNKAVMENEILREKLDETRFDLQKQQQAETAARLEVKTEKHQNIVDKASAKMERNEAFAENADTPKKKNKYLKQNNDHLKTQYKHLIAIAELENDSIEAEKLRAELTKELADNTERMYQNIEDYYSDKRDKNSRRTGYLDALNSNALSVEDKNQNLRDQTKQAVKDAKTYEQAYKETADSFNKDRTSTMKTVKKVDKLSQSVKDKVIALIKAKKEIPDELLDKVGKYDQNAYNELIQYNKSLDWLNKAWFGMKTSEQERIYTERENKVQQHQNIADRAQDKIDKNDALSDISTTASEQNKYEKENIKYLNTQYKHLLEIAKLHEDDVEYARLEAELQSKIAESYKAMFDNVQTEFENKISLISNDISDLDNEIKKVEASGRLIDASYYNYKISMENETLEKLKEEESSLVEQLKNVKMFSPAWYECQDAIQSVQNAQADTISSIKEYKDAINEIANTIQNDIIDAFHDITDEAELLITLLGDNLSDSDTGVLTEDGLAVLSLYVSQMNICKDAAESFHKEIKSMQEALDNNTLSFIDANGIQRDYASVLELKKHIKDFYSSYQDEIKHAYDYESKIVDMMIKKYQSELDYLKELIEKKKAELSAEKDLFEYSKNIQKQTDNINSLRKQIAALKGDTSKETESRIQKLQSQLKEAENELSDNEYERYISDQQDMLDNLYDEYAKLIDDVMKDHDKLLREGLDLFAQTASDVQDVIKTTAEEHGYEITAEMEKIIASIEGMGSLDSYLGVGGAVTQSLGDIVNEVHNAYVGISSDIQGMKDAIAAIGYQGKYDTSDPDNSASSGNTTGSTVNTPTQSENTNTPADNPINTDLSKLPNMDAIGAATKMAINKLLRNGTNKDYDPKKASSLNKYIYGKYGTALTVDEMAKLSEYLGFNYTSKQLAAENPNHSERKMKMLKKLQAYGFSNGGIVPDDALKLKDLGLGRASNGDTVIGTLKPKESVFNEKQTKMIQEYVNKAPDFKTLMDMGNYMDKMIKMPEVGKKDIPTQNIMQVGDVSFNLPNIHNYADFMNHAKKDPQFENMIGCIIKHQLGFGSYLKKTNVTFRN